MTPPLSFGHLDRDRIEVAEPTLRLQNRRGGDGEHAGAGARRRGRWRGRRHLSTGRDAGGSRGGAMVAGAEGRAGLDLNHRRRWP